MIIRSVEKKPPSSVHGGRFDQLRQVPVQLSKNLSRFRKGLGGQKPEFRRDRLRTTRCPSVPLSCENMVRPRVGGRPDMRAMQFRCKLMQRVPLSGK
jgi:hypothetical protein